MMEWRQASNLLLFSLFFMHEVYVHNVRGHLEFNMFPGHLVHHFGLTEQEWRKIKQNIDSKCRTAFRRKLRGLPLAVKAFSAKGDKIGPGDGDGQEQQTSEIVFNIVDEQELGSCSEDDSLQQLEDSHLQMHEVNYCNLYGE